MRVIICGAGQVGYGIAERLAAEQNDVSVIDTSPDLIRESAIRSTCAASSAMAPSRRAGGGRRRRADMIIAVTLYDEVNMVACQVAHSLFNVPTKIARIRAQCYLQAHYNNLFSRDHMPIDVIISPELEVGEMVLRRIATAGRDRCRARSPKSKVTMLAIECLEDCPVINTPLRSSPTCFPTCPRRSSASVASEQAVRPAFGGPAAWPATSSMS